MNARMLVAYASRHGATEGIAQRLASALRAEGIEVDLREMDAILDPGGYDGYAIGSAVYAGRWLGPANAFVRRYRSLLRQHPVWLFSSGPLSEDPAERAAARPHAIGAVVRDLSARGHEVFAGAWDRDAPAVGVLEKVMNLLPAGRAALPDGDFRDWEQIDRFGRTIAGEIALALAHA